MKRLASILISMLVAAAVARPCDMVTIGKHRKQVDIAAEVVGRADTIVRARAVGYSVSPVAGRMDGDIRFDPVGTVKGKPLPDLILYGVLVDRDDFNQGSSPYQVVRPSGLGGSLGSEDSPTRVTSAGHRST